MEKRDLYLDDINKLKTLIGFILKKDVYEIYAYKQHLTNEYFDRQLLEIDTIENWNNFELEEIQYQPVEMIAEIIKFILVRIEEETKSSKELKRVVKILIPYYDVKKSQYDLALENKLKIYR
jgi:hypothetical protein